MDINWHDHNPANLPQVPEGKQYVTCLIDVAHGPHEFYGTARFYGVPHVDWQGELLCARRWFSDRGTRVLVENVAFDGTDTPRIRRYAVIEAI